MSFVRLRRSNLHFTPTRSTSASSHETAPDIKLAPECQEGHGVHQDPGSSLSRLHNWTLTTDGEWSAAAQLELLKRLMTEKKNNNMASHAGKATPALEDIDDQSPHMQAIEDKHMEPHAEMEVENPDYSIPPTSVSSLRRA